jgi:hypothetical protein
MGALALRAGAPSQRRPAGLAAALAWGRRLPKAGGGPMKYHRLAFRNSLHRIGVVPFLVRRILNFVPLSPPKAK